MLCPKDRVFRFGFVSLTVLALFLSACNHSGTTPPAPIASITLVTPNDYLLAGGTLQLTATVKDAGGNILTDRNLTWASSNPSVLTVNSMGLLSGVAQGNATVSVSAEGQSSSVNVAVMTLALIRVTAPTFVLQAGTSTQLAAVAVDSADHEISIPVTWSSENGAIATVSGSGRVSALADGLASISATAASVTGSIRIEVQQPVTGKIAFVSRRGSAPTQQGGIYLMNSDGTQQQLVLLDPLERCSPDPAITDMCDIPWKQPMLASDGLRLAAVRRVIYDTEFAGDMIFECGTNGTACTKVDYPARVRKPGPIVALAGVADPSWSPPDGSRMAFGASQIQLWASATGLISDVPGTASLAGAQPTWSPDGKRIALTSLQSNDIWVVNLDGSQLTNLTHGAGHNSQPAWSPDGSRIAFVSSRDGDDEIYIMNVDGTSQINLTHNAASDEHPTWSPDSTRIAFQTNRDGNNEIYAISADGSNPINLTNNPADDTSPSWGP